MKLNKKIMLSAFAGASAIGAITPALATTAYGNNAINVPNHVYQSEDDLKYGLDDSTYLEVKESFKEQFAKKLEKEGVIKDSKVWNDNFELLNYSLEQFDNISRSRNCSYTELTSAVIDFARSQYKIPVYRTTNVKWNNITDMFNGVLNSVTIYMDHEHLPIDTQKIVINNAISKFNATLLDLERQNYKECDPYGAFNEVRKEMLSFFDTLSAGIAKVSASLKLATLFTKYNIVANKEGKKYSEIKDSFTVGQPINNINEILTFIDVETGAETKFIADRMIPGYTLTPRFAGFTVDKEKNHYGINIDWAATANHYVNTNKQLDAEGHIYDVQNLKDTNKVKELFALSEKIHSFDEAVAEGTKNLKIATKSVTLNESKEGQSTSIIDAYFGENGLTFVFPKSTDANARLEPFYNQYNEESKEGVATTQDLADAGLQVIDPINGQKVTRYLSEVIKTAQTKKDPATFTLAEKFVANCNVYSLTKIGNATTIITDGQENEKNTVQNKFYVAYANNNINYELNVGKKDAIKEFVTKSITSKDWTILPDSKQPGPSIDYVTSEQYFFNLCEKYTAVKDAIEAYINPYTSLKEAISSFENILLHQRMLIGAVSTMVIGFFALALFSSSKYEPRHGGLFELSFFFGMVACAMAYIFFGESNTTIKEDIIPPLKEILNKYDGIIDKTGVRPLFQKILKRINDDSTLLSLIRKTPKTNPTIVDKNDYEEKLQLYLKTPFAKYKEMSSFYSNFKWTNVEGITEQDAASINEVVDFLNNNYYAWFKKVMGTKNSDEININSLAGMVQTFLIGGGVCTTIALVALVICLICNALRGEWEKNPEGVRVLVKKITEISSLFIFVEILTLVSTLVIGAIGLIAFQQHISFLKHFNVKVWTEESLPENIEIDKK